MARVSACSPRLNQDCALQCQLDSFYQHGVLHQLHGSQHALCCRHKQDSRALSVAAKQHTV